MQAQAIVTGDMDDREDHAASTVGDPMAGGSLLEEPDDDKVATAILKAWTDQDALWAKHRAECIAAAYRREGRTDVLVDKREHVSEYQVRSWGTVDPQFNYAAKLCRHLPALLYGDPPQPRVEPEDVENHDVVSADFAQRVLLDLNADTNLDGVNTTRSAFDLASTYKSAFVWTMVAPQGTRQPVQIEAHPQAMTADQPLMAMVPGLDGQPMPQPLNPEEAVLRYVREDGTLTDAAAEAALQWVPALREEVLTSLQVRPLPPTAPDLWHASGALVAMFLPLRQWKALFPEALADLSDETRGKLMSRPEGAVKYLLHHLSKREQTRLFQQEGDDALVFGVLKWCAESPEYPAGFYGVAAGGGVLLDRRAWVHPTTGRGLRLPLSQIMQYREGTRGFYGGAGAMDILGPMQEVFAAAIQYEQDIMDRNAHRKTFVPLGSPVTPEEYEDPGQRLLVTGPQGQPFQEDLEPLDPAIRDLAAMAERQMRDAIGLSRRRRVGQRECPVRAAGVRHHRAGAGGVVRGAAAPGPVRDAALAEPDRADGRLLHGAAGDELRGRGRRGSGEAVDRGGHPDHAGRPDQAGHRHAAHPPAEGGAGVGLGAESGHRHHPGDGAGGGGGRGERRDGAAGRPAGPAGAAPVGQVGGRTARGLAAGPAAAASHGRGAGRPAGDPDGPGPGPGGAGDLRSPALG
ncbi:MAG: hypothetical protein IPI92_20260 [Gemmatimonadetes bacterium]|nr:hypothetical protein [Gemmatimonadota bacterium]